MTDPAPNHLRIYRDHCGKHAQLDGRELLLDGSDGLLITGAENPDEVTRVMITLLSPKVTIESELTDQEETMRRVSEQYTDLPVHDQDWTTMSGIPDTADVPAGQAWRVKYGDSIGTGIPDADPVTRHWAIHFDGGAQFGLINDEAVTLVSRLIPDPRRVIGTVKELEDLPSQAVVRPQKKGGILWEKGVEGLWYAAYMPVRASQSMDLPVWVIDMPESVSDGE